MRIDMKAKYIFMPALASMMLMACDDQKMEWVRPVNEHPIASSEIPLQLREKIANYNYIKAYSQQYMPNVKIGIGLGAADYLDSEKPAYAQTCNDNFEQFVTGNAMKHQSVVQSNGSLNLTTINAFLEKVPDDIEVYGHNLIWHTQQQQNYLKSLIAPEMIISGGDDDGMENIITNSDFENGNDAGWTGWSHYTRSVVTPGHDSQYALKCEMDGETAVNYDCQLWWPLTEFLQVGVTYSYSFWAKSPDNIEAQFIGQNASYGGIYKTSFVLGGDWKLCQGEFTYTGTDGEAADICRIGLQFGGVKNSVIYIDDFKFGKKVEDPMENIVTNSNFDDGTDTGWTGWSHYTRSVAEGEGHSGQYALKCAMDDATAVNYDCQLWWPLKQNLEAGVIYAYSFYLKSPDGVEAQFIGQNESYSGLYKSVFTAPKEWIKCEGEFLYDGSPADICRIGLQFGGKPNSVLYVDDFKFGKKKEQTLTPESARRKVQTRATTITFKPKSPEEKRTALLGAMEEWIKGMAEATKGRIKQWDVVNEPITDNAEWRGFDGKYGMEGDTDPVENEQEGLNLNWSNETGNGHFYWGYYIGKDYAAKAFEYARKYVGDDAKLYVNDYNLETNPAKLAELIKFVEYIDANGGHVDGIGTQMHVQKSITKEQVDAMFKTMAATGKLVRISELDVAMGVASLDEALQQEQSDIYQMIITSYKENVPEAQQGGICIWTLSDAADEHEYWLNGDAPNIFDGKYARKIAYKGVCDAIAGKDVSEEFNGDMWEKYYE